MFQNSTYWKFAEFKAKHKHTHYRQGQANLWLEIIGWVLWLEGKKKHTLHTRRGLFLTVHSLNGFCTKRNTPPNLETTRRLRLSNVKRMKENKNLVHLVQCRVTRLWKRLARFFLSWYKKRAIKTKKKKAFSWLARFFFSCYHDFLLWSVYSTLLNRRYSLLPFFTLCFR